MQKSIVFILLLTFPFFLTLSAGSVLFPEGKPASRKEKTIKIQPPVKSIEVFKNQLPESFPVIQLNSGDVITIEFDILSPNSIPIWYSIDHCSSDWESSDLFYQDFQTGFEYNPLNNPNPGYNTLIPYFHYELTLPNEEISILLSGNYRVSFFDSPGGSNPWFEAQFFVTENQGKIEASLTPSRNADLQRSHQEISIEYLHNLSIDNPYRDLQLIILQNRNPNHRVSDIQADYIQSGKVVFKNDPGLTWPGNNEFRVFNSNDIRFVSEGIDSIRFQNQLYHFFLSPFQNLKFKRYKYYRDLNGQFHPDKSGSDSPKTEADYYYHHFTFPFDAPLINEKLFLFGEFSQYRLNPNYEMTYNLAEKRYECSVLLKQGYYNYTIAAINENEDIEFDRFDGSHSVTENEYQLFIYLQTPGERHQRLINYTELSRIETN